jgi:thiamine biosynthesis lipoprotein
MASELDYTFRAMGSDVRLLIGDRLLANAPAALDAADRERAFVWEFSDRLSRFRPDSELSALNGDGRTTVPASPLLRAAVGAGIWAAERSVGLVDPTLVQALEQNGYDHSLAGVEPASLEEALAHAPPRQAASPDRAAHWRQVVVDDQTGMITRPPGLMIDTGGTGKGLCADAVAIRLGGYARFVVDCGGDIAVGGPASQVSPYQVAVEHPLTRRPIGSISVSKGGIATSGLNVRIWRRTDGSYAHHLLDPSTGSPVWSGLIGATALGDSALEAETLSKMALLLGPEGARAVLAEHGGVIVHDSGEVEAVGGVAGQIDERPVRELLAG